MSGSVAGSISCMAANKLHWVQAEDTYIASNFTDLICDYTTTPCLIGVGSKKCSKQAAAEKKHTYAHERVKLSASNNLGMAWLV